MYILVIGCGKVGYHLARELMAGGHEVLVIEREAGRVASLVEEMGNVALIGDGCEAGVMAEAGASRADVLIATTGQDEDNLVACQLAKHRFGVSRAIALVNNPSNRRLFRELGVDVVVSSTEVILKNIAAELPAHPLVHVLRLDGANREIVGIRIPRDASVVGRLLSEVELPAGSIVTLVIRKGEDPLRASEEVVLQADDEIVCMTTEEEEGDLLRALTTVG